MTLSVCLSLVLRLRKFHLQSTTNPSGGSKITVCPPPPGKRSSHSICSWPPLAVFEPVQRSMWYCPLESQSVTMEKVRRHRRTQMYQGKEVTYSTQRNRPRCGNTCADGARRRGRSGAGFCYRWRWRRRWGRRRCLCLRSCMFVSEM